LREAAPHHDRSPESAHGEFALVDNGLPLAAAQLNNRLNRCMVSVVQDPTARRDSDTPLKTPPGAGGDLAADNATHEMREQLLAASRRSVLGELASSLAHELNQPLAAIATFAQAGSRLLAGDRGDVARAREVLAEIAKQALRAGDVIRRMQQIIRHQEPAKVQVDCRELAEDFMVFAEPVARIHGVRITLDVADSLPPIQADPVQLLQLLMILFQNAIDAVKDLPRDRGSIVIALSQRGHQVELAVTDNGVGVGETAVDRLFRPFFTTKSGGTGLGLAICRSIAAHHGGDITFHSPPAGGARFCVNLPAGGVLPEGK
jgi:C4-dicarboxylate-specific signal transduction histidine kinase